MSEAKKDESDLSVLLGVDHGSEERSRCITMMDITLDEFTDLLYYCDSVAKILKDNGFKGKAEALENRYMKFKHLL